MVRGYCPNQECPNIDVLDADRPCPTCGRDVIELSPREYWRTRTIKMMHAHEIAEIAEIHEVARRTLGEASVVPKAQLSEDTSPSQELESVDDAAMVDSSELLISEGSLAVAVESISLSSEIESAAEAEEVMPSAVANAIREGDFEEHEGELQGELQAADLVSERKSPRKEEGEFAESRADLESASSEAEPATPLVNEISERSVDSVDLVRDESAVADVEEERETVWEEVSDVDQVPFAEGLVGARVELETQEEESIHDEPRSDAETLVTGEVSEAQEIAELEEGHELTGEAENAELTEWKRSEAPQKESAEEVSAPLELPVEGGVERPASPVRIITFREGGTEIGICPYCGRFVRGSDLGRHKLKHRLRNVLGFQAED